MIMLTALMIRMTIINDVDDDNADDNDDDDGNNLYSSMITASCSSTVSRLCGSKPALSILLSTNILAVKVDLGWLLPNFFRRFLNNKNKSWPVLGNHLWLPSDPSLIQDMPTPGNFLSAVFVGWWEKKEHLVEERVIEQTFPLLPHYLGLPRWESWDCDKS